jgi:hypothetical protein
MPGEPAWPTVLPLGLCFLPALCSPASCR